MENSRAFSLNDLIHIYELPFCYDYMSNQCTDGNDCKLFHYSFDQIMTNIHEWRRYKTELCRSYLRGQFCKYESKCRYAHGRNELRSIEKPNWYKTYLCKNYHRNGFCEYGIRCNYVHEISENKLQFIEYLRGKTQLCGCYYKNGSCENGFCVYGPYCSMHIINQINEIDNNGLSSIEKLNKFKTLPCKYFHIQKYCKFGPFCNFSHEKLNYI